MNRKLTKAVRREVEQRANGRCEYCRIGIEDTYLGGEIDHILAVKHGGATESANLAFACQPCNRNKGSDIGSIGQSGNFVPFFNPRIHTWNEHFKVNEEAEVEPLTEIGQVTIRILGFNDLERVEERRGLIEIGRYEWIAI